MTITAPAYKSFEFTCNFKLERYQILAITHRMLWDYNDAAYDLILTEWENDHSEFQSALKINVEDYGKKAPVPDQIKGEPARRISELVAAFCESRGIDAWR